MSGEAPVATMVGPFPVTAASSADSRSLDWWAAAVFAVTIAQVLALARLYPEHRFDPDLLAYFTYFRNWLSDDRTIQHLPYFTAPKLLLVFTLGALGDATRAFYCSAAASGALGVVLYLLCRDSFGHPTAVLTSLVLLFDPSKAMLTLTSSADLYLALLLFLAVLLCDRGRPLAAAVSLLGAALVKPVALPCAAYFLLGDGRTRRHWLAAAIPFLAVPIMLLGNRALLGHALGGTQFFVEFASMGGAAAIGPGEVVHFALWSQLVRSRFVATASFGVVGLLLWITGGRARLIRPLLLMPLLFLGGYLGLSVVTPFPPYFRYFWPLEIWFLPFVIFGAVEGARRIAAGDRRLEYAVAAVILVLLADGLVGRSIDYRRDYALPAEQSMQLAESARDILRAHRQAGEVVLVPLGLLPFMLWEFPEAARDQLVYTAERVARDDTPVQPDWILDVPGMYTSDRARERVAALLQQRRFTVVIGNEHAALFGPVAAGATTAPSPAGA
jgi:hypothetical protein